LPSNRGFDTTYGFWSANTEYYSKRYSMPPFAYDFHENDEIIDDPQAATIYAGVCFWRLHLTHFSCMSFSFNIKIALPA